MSSPSRRMMPNRCANGFDIPRAIGHRSIFFLKSHSLASGRPITNVPLTINKLRQSSEVESKSRCLNWELEGVTLQLTANPEAARPNASCSKENHLSAADNET